MTAIRTFEQSEECKWVIENNRPHRSYPDLEARILSTMRSVALQQQQAQQQLLHRLEQEHAHARSIHE
jgi:hypothetical protein